MQLRKPLLMGLLALGYLFDVLLFASLLGRGQFGYDAYAYWSVFHIVPWWVFLWAWTALLVATLTWLGGRWTLVLLAFPPLVLELYAGNVNLLLAAAIALGFRYPAAWAFVLLTKVTPGIGVLWFALRREWPELAIALGTTALIVVVSFILAPALWGQWFSALGDLSGPTEGSLPIPLLLRLPLAAAVVWWGARTSRRWAVPVAATIATPVLWIGWPAWLVVLLGALPLLREEGEARETGPERQATPIGAPRDLVTGGAPAISDAVGSGIAPQPRTNG